MDDLALKILDSLPVGDRQHVCPLACHLKDAYVDLLRTNTRHRHCGASDTFWVFLATKVHAIGGNAVSYMSFQFEYGPPFTDLDEVCSDHAVEQYRLEIQTDAPVRRADGVLQRQLKTVEMLMDAGRSLRQVLLDSIVELNPLVFYCLAVAGGLSDLSAQGSTQAALFLEKYPAYRASTILGDLFVEPSEPPTTT